MIQNTNYHGPTAFFRKHWNGDYSLARSYWVNTLLVSLFAPALGLLISPLLQDLPARYSSASVLALTALGLLIWVWAITGTWASANKHVDRGGKQGWATAAKLVIILSIIRTVSDVASFGTSLEDHLRVALGEQAGPQYSVHVSADGQSIVLTGGMNDGAAQALSNALNMAPAVKNIVLSSTGGWVREGTLVADIISQRSLSTYVSEECTSACTIAFLAGKNRIIGPNARIGFHQFKSVGETFGENSDQTTARVVYEKTGLSREFISKIVATPAEEVWYPEKKELLAANVITQATRTRKTASVAAQMPKADVGEQDVESGLIAGFEQAANEINRSTPTMVDSETRLDKATAGPGAVLTYHYTFPNYTSDDLDGAWIKSELRENVTSNVCESEVMKPALEYGGKYVYSYSGSDQIVIASFQITRKECGYGPRASGSQNFVLVTLPHGVQIELPRNWQVLSENQRITIDSSVQSRAELAGEVFDASSDLNFGANYYDDAGKTAAIMNVRYYPNLDISQADAHASGIPDISELDSAIHDSMLEAGQINGFTVLEWSGTSKQEINGITALVTEYKRSSVYNSSNFKVRLVRVFNKEKSFTMTVSYREDHEHLLRPICDRIISSLNI